MTILSLALVPSREEAVVPAAHFLLSATTKSRMQGPFRELRGNKATVTLQCLQHRPQDVHRPHLLATHQRQHWGPRTTRGQQKHIAGLLSVVWFLFVYSPHCAFLPWLPSVLKGQMCHQLQNKQYTIVLFPMLISPLSVTCLAP